MVTKNKNPKSKRSTKKSKKASVIEKLVKDVATPESTSENLPTNETLYIRNIPEKLLPSQVRINLYLLLSTFGEIIYIKVGKPRSSLRGQAFVTFRTIDEAHVAKTALDQELFFGQSLHLEFSRQPSRIPDASS
ncbi:hypothetical protein TBLA_0D04460 [Henningerozyma blattae CBS 6284]|uniref:RRM domain-containing protein n=1 Tax=Henningerozyma blattae (strain ATCC 34711 / CBS 6284 / DSM 70876 / NBRC 10599 / NRRL Y-10934 / UCD 77-7) TaxID=1071380 RepID=I2H3J0_HENB6|nr:hypothetical protein TBLA_0D04460 [Tetrapisispora blattae CBS 6284]CCH60942.1 hypothetical protein TBLA_0D04460 [Tetrapisispora blattae CBS 6284]